MYYIYIYQLIICKFTHIGYTNLPMYQYVWYWDIEMKFTLSYPFYMKSIY